MGKRTKKAEPTQFRQGDVWIECIASIPGTTKALVPQDRIVLAHGEVTGHAHAIYDLDAVQARIADDGTIYLRVTKPTEIRHEEHAPIPLTPGDYKSYIQREYSPEAIRNVAD